MSSLCAFVQVESYGGKDTYSDDQHRNINNKYHPVGNKLVNGYQLVVKTFKRSTAERV